MSYIAVEPRRAIVRAAYATLNGAGGIRRSWKSSCGSINSSLNERSASGRKKLAQARIDRLLAEAASLSRAADIRAYVRAVEQAIERERIAAPADDPARWSNWALTQADRIDPVKNRQFLQAFEEGDSSER
ncbi:hypothetical protein [Bradyrhizobium uaiense]|uniref:Uncharacterized protein n=1 Tax=Bradyrhizobium uaiense TaxID=2594946 RepID=A0A6P1BFH6_9BRAD|nr:hypothetical protein [Bradyrhizobium uaiense]NEU96924.1 hypothetical protein [Bradyrhizobium uaiense]